MELFAWRRNPRAQTSFHQTKSMERMITGGRGRTHEGRPRRKHVVVVVAVTDDDARAASSPTTPAAPCPVATLALALLRRDRVGERPRATGNHIDRHFKLDTGGVVRRRKASGELIPCRCVCCETLQHRRVLGALPARVRVRGRVWASVCVGECVLVSVWVILCGWVCWYV